MTFYSYIGIYKYVSRIINRFAAIDVAVNIVCDLQLYRYMLNIAVAKHANTKSRQAFA
jgi:hypothetical protein